MSLLEVPKEEFGTDAHSYRPPQLLKAGVDCEARMRVSPLFASVFALDSYLTPMFGLQYLSCTLTDDDARSHGIAGGHTRHYRAVCNAKVFDSIDFKLAVYDRHRIASHFHGTRPMVVSGGRIANEVF
jgi:hypothetical protein